MFKTTGDFFGRYRNVTLDQLPIEKKKLSGNYSQKDELFIDDLIFFKYLESR